MARPDPICSGQTFKRATVPAGRGRQGPRLQGIMLSLRLRFPIPTQLPLLHSKPQLSVSTSFGNPPRATATDSAALNKVNGFSNDEQEPLPAGLRRESMPRHVAVIMDGNVRWARRRGLPSGSGHQAGARALRELVHLSLKWGIRVLTVFAFSCDNWVRPKVSALKLLVSVFNKSKQEKSASLFFFCVCVGTV